MADDLELYRSWKDGNERAGSELFSRHFDSIYRFFRHKVGDAAEDLTQQTFLACVQASPGFRGDSSFRTYLFTAARSKLYTHLDRRRRKDDPVDFGVTSLHAMGTSPSGHVARVEEERVLHEALHRLPLELQIALELFHFEGLRGPEIARVLEIPEGTVRSRLRRGLAALREQVETLTAEPALRESVMQTMGGRQLDDDE